MKERYIYIAIPALSVLLLGMVFMYFVFRAFNRNTENIANVQPTPVVNNQINTPVLLDNQQRETESTQPEATPILFGTEYLRIPLDRRWKIVEEEYPYGETVLIKPVQQANITIADSSMRITIEKNITDTRRKEIIELYTKRDAIATSDSIHGYAVTRYTGVILGPDSNGQPSTMQNVGLLFDKEDNLIWISYHYVGDIPDNSIEAEFEEIIQNMTFL